MRDVECRLGYTYLTGSRPEDENGCGSLSASARLVVERGLPTARGFLESLAGSRGTESRQGSGLWPQVSSELTVHQSGT